MADNINQNLDNIHLSDGKVNISEGVIASIAKVAAEEVEGVFKTTQSVTSSITDIFAKNKKSQGVKVDSLNNEVSIDVAVDLKYGCHINDVAYKVQKNIKSAIETMTGLIVKEVNVQVSGLKTEKVNQDTKND